MKTLPLSILAILFIAYQTSVSQQITPSISSSAHHSYQVGMTKIKIDYSRPNVNGRKVFGELIPFGKIWRTGANESSLISISTSIIIDDQKIDPGTYSIFTIPNQNEWTFILNRDTTLWGDRGYDPEKDVIRVEVAPHQLNQRTETFSINVKNTFPDRFDLVLEWENIELSVPISLPTDEVVRSLIENKLKGSPTSSDYYAAARYYLDSDNDLEQALKWINKRIELDGEQFGVLRYKSLIEKKLGKDEQAKTTMQKSLSMAKEAGNDHYFRMNEHSLKDWSKEKASIFGEDLVTKSIRYHDPGNRWSNSETNVSLYEHRPGGNYRITDLKMDPAKASFALEQRRGKDLINRSWAAGECTHLLNDKNDFSKEDLEKFNLTCAYTTRMKDYYQYLWALPMKLKDPGSIIDPNVYLREFFGQDLLEVKVTYDEEVGNDIWYFYFHPNTYALSGYRFYHDESKNDGEYILVEGEEQINGMKIPAKRHWYTHADRRYLGTDEIIK